MVSELGVNPDQRIQEDNRQLTLLTVDLGVGLLQSTMLLVSFIGVLWSLSSVISFTVGGHVIAIPGYMVWCAIGYASIGSGLTWLVGHPLIGLNAMRQAREADFRFALVRVSESAESIALYGGEADERRLLDLSLGPVIAAMRRLSGSVARLTWITSGYSWLAIIVPVLVAAPGYFGGQLSLGGLMMVVGAFNYVQNSLRWFVDNFARLADWRAALGRVAAFNEALDGAEAVEEGTEQIEFLEHPQGCLAFERVGILLKDGSVVIKDATAEIHPGERVLIVGASGSGKSTLFRAIARLWPWGSGRILLPPRAGTMFMPQHPYLPLGPLRAATAYPAGPTAFSTEAIEAALVRVGLPELVPMLDARGAVGPGTLRRAAAAVGLCAAPPALPGVGVPRRGHGSAGRGQSAQGDVDLRARAAPDGGDQHRPPARAGGVPYPHPGAEALAERRPAAAEAGHPRPQPPLGRSASGDLAARAAAAGAAGRVRHDTAAVSCELCGMRPDWTGKWRERATWQRRGCIR